MKEQIAAANRKTAVGGRKFVAKVKNRLKSVKKKEERLSEKRDEMRRRHYDEIVRSAKQEAQDIRRKNEAEIIRDKSKVMDGMKNEIAKW